MCGECGAEIDDLGRKRFTTAGPVKGVVEGTQAPASGGKSRRLFIVARGFPELVEQLRDALGDSEAVQIIEDRRLTSRDAVTEEGREVSLSRADLRRRIQESDSTEVS